LFGSRTSTSSKSSKAFVSPSTSFGHSHEVAK